MYPRLLIIADDKTADSISHTLGSDFWAIYTAELGRDSLSAVARVQPNAILVDARQPGDSFGEFLGTIRLIEGMSSIPLVALIRPEQDAVEFLDAGADDAWREPIRAREFESRVMQIHRRVHQSSSSNRLRHGAIELDLDRYTVRASGPSVQLTPMQVGVLRHLMEHPGVVISPRELLQRVWRNTDLADGAVRACMKRLRKLLAATGAIEVIRTAGGGYVFETTPPPLQVPWQMKGSQSERAPSTCRVRRESAFTILK